VRSSSGNVGGETGLDVRLLVSLIRILATSNNGERKLNTRTLERGSAFVFLFTNWFLQKLVFMT
jgi:hypothetical protein